MEATTIFVYSNASMANNMVLELGHIILLLDEEKNCSVVPWSSVHLRTFDRLFERRMEFIEDDKGDVSSWQVYDEVAINER